MPFPICKVEDKGTGVRATRMSPGVGSDVGDSLR